MRVFRYQMVAPKEPLAREELEAPTPGFDEVLIEIAGCGLCHTDLGFLDGSVRPRHPLPLTLGHEISGRVVAAGEAAASWRGKAVIVPAVIPCGSCGPCRAGHGNICKKQLMPGNDEHGGFASHIVVPARGLCAVPEGALQGARPELLSELSVIADAVTTPYQALIRSELAAGDLAIVVGLGGVGGFAAQLAAARGALVVGLDIDAARRERLLSFGVSIALDPRALSIRELRKAIADFACEHAAPDTGWRIFECSGTVSGQETAFSLLGPGAWLGVIGFTREPVTLRLSNLMAFDARAQGSWGCLPEHYPAVLDLVLSGRLKVTPFVERHPMSALPDVLAAAASHSLKTRPILIP